MKTPTAADIPAVKGAFRGTSFSPEKREEQRIREYIDYIEALRGEFARYETGDNRKELWADLEWYRAGYARRMNAYLAAHSNVVSSFVAGPSNFPGRQMEKRNTTVDKRLNEWMEWSNKQIARLRRKYDPRQAARAPISSDDPDAAEKLQAKIARAERMQETMKAANRIVRKKKLSDAEKVAALVKLDGISEETAWQLLQPDFAGRVGFADYKLKNNNANIRRMKARVAELEAAPTETVEVERPDGIIVEENAEDNRLRIHFPDKPSAEVRRMLKSRGFRWAPSVEAWQRQLTDNARHDAQWVLGQLGGS